MKAIVCELCGSNDLVKDGNMFVCQHCGTKYTTEEARKLLVEANVTVSGHVSVDGVASVDNLLRRANDFETRGNFERADEYYNRVLDIDFDNDEVRHGLERIDRSNRRMRTRSQAPIRKRVVGPNLVADFTGGNWGSVATVFVDGKRVANVNGGKTAELTLSPGTHKVGVAGGIRKCKDPVQVVIDGYTTYRMDIELRGLTFKCRVYEA